MADNYLENQYEQYQARKAAWERERQYGKKVATPASGTPPKSGHPEPNTYHKKRVFITGGAQGIGKSIVEAFAKADCQVAFCDLNVADGSSVARETGTLFCPIDVSDASLLEQCLQELLLKWGDIDIIVNNAGISPFAPITETSVADFDRILSINLRPVFVTARTLACHRKQMGSEPHYGRIINICSTRYLMSEPGSEGYAASKGGIYSLTHALAISLAEQHITVNSLSPGWVQTSHYEQLRPEDHAQHPSGRVGRPEDIARLCLFLCQEENNFINGENITVDGGMTRKMIYAE